MAVSDTNRVVLFDLRIGGHHIQYIHYLTTYLLEQGAEVRFVTTGTVDDERLSRDDERFRVERLNHQSFADVPSIRDRLLIAYRALSSCFEYATDWNADVVHMMDVNRLELPLAFAARKTSTNRVFALFGTLVAPYYDDDTAPFTSPKKYFHAFNRRSLRYSLSNGYLDGLFVLSEMTRDQLLDCWPDVPTEVVTAVPDPIAPIDNSDRQNDARERLSLPPDCPLVLFFGRLRYEKGADVLLESIAQLPDNVAVVLAGPPGSVTEADVQERKSSLSKPDQLVNRVKFIPEESVHDYYRSADLVALPYRSEYSGTSGILQHAAASATPVVATDVGQIGQIVREWELGTVVEPESPSAFAGGIRNQLTAGPIDIETQANDYVEEHHWREWAAGIYNCYTNSATAK